MKELATMREDQQQRGTRLMRFWTETMFLPIVLIVSGLLLVVFIPHTIMQHNLKRRLDVAYSNTNAIMLAIERFNTEHGRFPTSFTNDGEFLRWCDSHGDLFPPENPFTGKQMKDIAFGEKSFKGEFSYICMPPGEYKGKLVDYGSYYLLGYGTKSTAGEDVNGDGIRDHVIVVLGKSLDHPLSLADAIKLEAAGGLSAD